MPLANSGRIAAAIVLPGCLITLFAVSRGLQPARTEVRGSPCTNELESAARNRPLPTGSAEFAAERHRMVETQMGASWDGRTAVTDPGVLEALRTVPRHAFVPAELRERTYADTPLPIGHGQTISQPYIVGIMTELLKLAPESKVLEIGTGSGYQAAVLAHLTPHVYTIEIVAPLADRAAKTLREQGYQEVAARQGDGYFGWKEEGPFDAILVTCAAGHVPPPLWDQLQPGGRMVIPIGGPYEVQRLVVLTKEADGARRSRSVMPVRFVPLTGDGHGAAAGKGERP